jgi:hypothetical protein
MEGWNKIISDVSSSFDTAWCSRENTGKRKFLLTDGVAYY